MFIPLVSYRMLQYDFELSLFTAKLPACFRLMKIFGETKLTATEGYCSVWVYSTLYPLTSRCHKEFVNEYAGKYVIVYNYNFADIKKITTSRKLKHFFKPMTLQFLTP